MRGIYSNYHLMCKKICFLFLLSIIVCCRNRSEQFYIISREDSLSKISTKRDNGSFMTPPKISQGNYNFIVDSNNNYYYYSIKEKPIIGVAGNDIIDQEQIVFMNLEPNNIFIIPKGCEQAFFRENVLNVRSIKAVKSVYLASLKDTLNDEFNVYMRKTAKDASLHISLTIRPVLLEEKTVLNYKLTGKYYNSKNIKWDSTKIDFENNDFKR